MDSSHKPPMVVGCIGRPAECSPFARRLPEPRRKSERKMQSGRGPPAGRGRPSQSRTQSRPGRCPGSCPGEPKCAKVGPSGQGVCRLDIGGAGGNAGHRGRHQAGRPWLLPSRGRSDATGGRRARAPARTSGGMPSSRPPKSKCAAARGLQTGSC